MSVHPRVSVNSISSMKLPLESEFSLWADLGIDHVGLIAPTFDAYGWDAGRQAIVDSGLKVSSFSCYKPDMAKSIEFSAAVGTDVLYLPPGSAGSLTWEEAAEAFCKDTADLVARGEEIGVRLALEPTNPLRSDLSFVHTVRDAIDLARMSGWGVVIDFYSAWYERGLAELVRQNIDLVALVQICDFKIGTTETATRFALGDGDLPLDRLFGTMLDAGYEGVFDLEILGAPVEGEGYRSAIGRSVERASEILDRLGA